MGESIARLYNNEMKKLLTTMFVALLMVGCQEETSVKERAAMMGWEEAIDFEKLEFRRADVEGLLKIPCKACKKEVSLKGEACANCSHPIADSVRAYKDGLSDEILAYAPNQQTPYTGWAKEMYDNGQMAGLAQFKDGKPDGLWYDWYENGRKKGESNYKDGYLMSAQGGKPNGHQCPEIDVRDGNGVVVLYNNDGTEDRRLTYKDGELIEE
jgi:antitoxin component YwqK of YwqJK toxin-antitoxin module